MSLISAQNQRHKALAGILLGACLLASVLKAQAEALKGNVQETGATEAQPDFAPIAPMPAPVMRKRKPLSDSVQDNKLKGQAQDEGSNTLQGNADEQNLSSARPAMDNSPHTLQGAAVANDAELQAQDPDTADRELMVEWDKWHNRLLWSIQSGVQELINSPENVEPRFDQRTGRVILGPNIPLGTKATFFVRVSVDRRIVKAKIIQPSGYPDYDKALLDAIYALDGSSILRFPRGSQRQRVNETATIITSDRGDREFFKFGDVERTRIPGQ